MDFDRHALTYERDLARGLRWSGLGPAWFAEQRVSLVRDDLKAAGIRVRTVLDFGCGVGNHIPCFRRAFPGSRIVGLDTSPESLEVAAARHTGPDLLLCHPENFAERHTVDLVYLNGVLHHVAPDEHAAQLGYCRRVLRPGGALAIFDNNPFSPAARLVMWSIPFDCDAVMVSPFRLARLVASCGFSMPTLRFHFLFPRALRFLSGLESRLSTLPLGAQYSLLGVAIE